MSKVIGWWSGGITSAVTCKLCVDEYGKDSVRIVFIDTQNEDDDTYRFKKDCEDWYGVEIETITRIGEDEKYNSIQHVWYKYKSLNIANGAICSSRLKREVRMKWERENEYSKQAFGFDTSEERRAKAMTLNYGDTAKPFYPLLERGLSKQDCIDMVVNAGIVVPRSYALGFNNNNCLKTGCVQGGIGYWQKMNKDFPEKYKAMAKVEHDLTNLKGKPVTMCKDQSKKAKKSGNTLIFLEKHKDYPEIKTVMEMRGREPKPLTDCNGLSCGVRDFDKISDTHDEINYDTDG